MATGVGIFALTDPATYTCDASEYWDTAKAADTAGATHALTKTNCCTAKALCSTYTCPAGKKQTTTTGATCASGSCATSDESTCCVLDTTKCGCITALTCDSDKFWDSAKAGTTITGDPVTG